MKRKLKFDQILKFARQDTIRITDARTLIFLRAAKDHSAVLQSMSQMIAFYDLEIRHQRGHPNPEKSKHSTWLPDLLSRAFKTKQIHQYTRM